MHLALLNSSIEAGILLCGNGALRAMRKGKSHARRSARRSARARRRTCAHTRMRARASACAGEDMRSWRSARVHKRARKHALSRVGRGAVASASSLNIRGKVYHENFKLGKLLQSMTDSPEFDFIPSTVRNEIQSKWMSRWEDLHNPLHGAGYCLDPEFHGHGHSACPEALADFFYYA